MAFHFNIDTANKWLLGAVLLSLLCLIVPSAYIVIYDGIDTSHNLHVASANLPDTAASVKQAADTSNMASTQILNLTGSLTSLVGNSTTHAPSTLFGLLYNLDQFVSKANTLAASANTFTTTATARVEALATLQAKSETAMDAITTLPVHLNPLLDTTRQTVANIGEDANDIHLLLADPATAGMRDHISGLAEQGARFLHSGQKFEEHVDAWAFPPKYNGNHRFVHDVVQTGKYILKISPGVAGGIAIAKGN